MTAREMARQACANHEPDGSCLGMDVPNDGKQFLMKQAGQRCLVACGTRCLYFEQAVLALVDIVRDVRRLAELTMAENDYQEKCYERRGSDQGDMERGISTGTSGRKSKPTHEPTGTSRLARRSTRARRSGLFGRRIAGLGSAATERGRDR